MWSYLRGFNKMSKEMRSAHRIDVLSVALEYYSIRSKRKLGMFGSGQTVLKHEAVAKSNTKLSGTIWFNEWVN